MIVEHKQVDMKNSTQLLQPVNYLVKEQISNGKHFFKKLEVALNEFVNKDDYVGFLSSDPEPINFLSVDESNSYEYSIG